MKRICFEPSFYSKLGTTLILRTGGSVSHLSSRSFSVFSQPLKRTIDQKKCLQSRPQSTQSLSYINSKSCNSCGIGLQNTDLHKPGYFIIPKSISGQEDTKKYKKDFESNYEKLLNRISDADRSLLMNQSSEAVNNVVSVTDSEVVETQSIEKDPGEPENVNEHHLYCKRCYDALFQSRFDLNEHPIEHFESIISKIPANAKIVYVTSAYDFPMSINKRIFDYVDKNNILFAVTKTDLLFATEKQNQTFGHKYFQDFLNYTLNIPRSNVLCMSGLRNWDMDGLINKLGKRNFFIGDVNSGKSTLINAVLAWDEKYHPKKKSKLYKNTHNHFNKHENGPGISYMPSFTRDFMEYEIINGESTIYDVPGFSYENHGIFQYMSPQQVKVALKGDKVFKKGTHDARYDSVKGGQCYTVGGYFYMVPPKNTIIQVRNCIAGTGKVFRNADSAVKAASSQLKELEYVFNINAESTNDLKKYIMPQFFGAIDLVIKNVGFINIKPTGAKKDTGSFEVYLPQGVDAVIREPITTYITRTISDHDKAGNFIEKEDRIKKAVKEIKSLPLDKSLVCKLVRVD